MQSFQSPYSVRLDLLSSPLGSRYIIVSAGSLACLVVVHLKHAHALILALALTFASRPRNARPRDAYGRPLPHGATGIPTMPDDLALPPAGLTEG